MAESNRFWWRMIAAATTAGAATALGLQQVGLWNASRPVDAALVMLGTTAGFATATEAAWDDHRRRKGEDLRESVRAVLSPLLFDLQDATGISARRLGVAAYRRHSSIWPWRPERLERLLRLRPVNQGASGIVWRPGVGVIGQCVERGEDVIEDLATLDEQLADVGADEWSTLASDLTYGFTFDEYQRVRGKYGVVLATPIIHETPAGSRIVGCVSVDGPPDSFDVMADEAVRGAAASAADVLAALVPSR